VTEATTVDYSSKLQKFDLIVIGSGSGLDVANAAYQHGLRVAVIEKGKMGGTCLNRGCIPSKLLIHSADVAETIKSAHVFGLKVEGFSVDFHSIVEQVNGIVDLQSEKIRKSFEGKENPKLFANECKFVGEKMISIEGGGSGRRSSNDNGNNERIITADKILIASGTRPRIPEIDGLKESGYITSDEALRLKKQPKVLTIIGGGYIACELAHFFGALGTKINIIQLREVLIPDEDQDISRKFTEVFSKKYNVYLGYETTFVTKEVLNDKNNSNNNNNYSKFHVIAKNASGKQIDLGSDELLIATGRIPNSDMLGLEKTGVKINKKGFIITDRYLETNVKGIFALGDAIGRYLFKHSANYEAQYAFYNMLHQDHMVPISYYAMPHAIFSSPQVAGVGFTEQELIKKQQENNNKNNTKNIIDYRKSVYLYINTAMGLAIKDHDGFVKFLIGKKDGKILGCHIIGSQASILIHEVLAAMRGYTDDYGDGTIENITKSIHIHPALSEVVARAAGAATATNDS
jgi:mycothione reductase